jgi:molybdate transport system substrate-binding protein
MATLHWISAVLAAGLILLLPSASHGAPVLRVAAASDLATCIEEINLAFRQSVGVDVKTSLGSSGNFHAQILNGAPFDVFLSANIEYPLALADAGLAERKSLTVYAIGRLAMIVHGPTLNPEMGMALLNEPRVERIAIANPDVAPYGRAARAALQSAGLWQKARPRLIIGENVAQTAQFVYTGNAPVGFVGASHVMSGQRAWLVPSSMHPPIEQGGIITKKGRDHPLAARYLAFLHSDSSQAILRRHGFGLPGRSE